MVQISCKKILEYIPIRAIIWVMIFTACLISYMLRVNMSINIIAMVNSTGGSKNNTGGDCNSYSAGKANLNMYAEEGEVVQATLPDYGPRYDWDQAVQGLILGSYFWGYLITSAPGGYLAERFGAKLTVGAASLFSAIVTAVTPLVAGWHYSVVIFLRMLLGFMGGVTYPALHCLISRWAPPIEKGKFIGAILGGTLGTVLTWPLLGAVIESWGWDWSFYVPAIITLIWTGLWFLLVSDYPDNHPRITEEERDYIVKGIGDNISKKKLQPPYLKMALSIPFWAVVVCHYGNLWGLYLLLTGGPKFMSEAMNYNLSNSGILASLPHLVRMFSGFIFGYIGDLVRKKQWLSVTLIRKSFILFSHLIPGALLYCLIAVGCNPAATVALLTFSLGSNGASTITNLQNNQDLAPNFAGTIYGIMNAIGSTTGFITPMVTAHFTAERSGLSEWHIIFSIGATIYVACGVVFIFFGSGDKQSWNDVETTDDGPGSSRGGESTKV